MVTVATTCRVADRSPPIRSGSPRGTSIFQSTCQPVMPTARPASMTVRSIASNPA